MTFTAQSINDVVVVTYESKGDARGFFMRTYDQQLFAEHGLPTNWVQQNHALTKTKGTLRGLHFLYPPHTEGKLIRMALGTGFWAFVDLRKGSPTFGKWGSVVLSSEKPQALFIPRGVANGLCTLSDDCHVLYNMDQFYYHDAEGGVAWNDPDIGVQWPLAPTTFSDRDRGLPSFKEFLTKTNGGLVI